MVHRVLNHWCFLTAKTLDSVTRVRPLQKDRIPHVQLTPPTGFFHTYYYRPRAGNTEGNKIIIFGSILYGNPTASLYHNSLQVTNQSSQQIFSQTLEMIVIYFYQTMDSGCDLGSLLEIRYRRQRRSYLKVILHLTILSLCDREGKIGERGTRGKNTDTKRQMSRNVLDIPIPPYLITPIYPVCSLLWQLLVLQPSRGHSAQACYRVATWGLIRDEADGDIKF